MRAAVLPALFCLAACAGARLPPAAAPPVISSSGGAEKPVARTTDPPLPPREAPPNRCLPAGAPKPPPSAETHEPSTCQDHRRVEASIGRELARRYKPSVKGSTVDVSFDCDPLTNDVNQVVFETGGGHGGSLVLWRLERRAGSEVFEAAGFAFTAPYFRAADFHEFTIARGEIPRAALLKALDRALPAMTAVIRELEPPPIPYGLHGRSFFTSSGDFHSYVQVRDESERELERSFTGYPGTNGQRQYLGVQLAEELLTPLIEKLAFAPGSPSDAEKTFFVRHYLEAQPRLHHEFAWWVRERYMHLAGYMGTLALVPNLVDEMKSELATLGDGPSQTGVPERHLEDAAGAIAALTGWDARLDDTGKKRPIIDVAKDYVSECGRALEK